MKPWGWRSQNVIGGDFQCEICELWYPWKVLIILERQGEPLETKQNSLGLDRIQLCDVCSARRLLSERVV